MLSELEKERLNVCKECPLYTKRKSGPICDLKKYMNADGD